MCKMRYLIAVGSKGTGSADLNANLKWAEIIQE